MSRSKIISKVELSVCRFRKLLSSGQSKVTVGSGCVVNLKSNSDESKCGVFLITTTQVVTKADLLSNTGITVEFLDGRNGKLLSFDLDFKDVSGIPDAIPGRVLENKEARPEMEQESFVIIPVQKFDNRHAITKKLFAFNLEKKHPMPCSYQSNEHLRSAISSRQVLCYVICDDRRNDGFYTEPYCLEFCKDTNEFVLTSALSRDDADVMKSFKDFHKEEKPKGALLLNAEGKFVGMLGIARSDERKLFPLFLPTVNKGKSEPAVVPMAEGRASDRATSEEKDSQIKKIKSIRNGDQNTGNRCCTSVVQGSSNTDASSLLVVDMPKSLCPLENLPSSSSLSPFKQDVVSDHQSGQQHLEDDHEVLQPPDADNGSFVLPDADNGSFVPPDADNGSFVPPDADNGSFVPPDAEDGSFVPPDADNSSFEINEDVHQPQNPDLQHNWPNIATQHSYYDQSLSSVSSVQGTFYGVPETASPPPDKEAEPPAAYYISSSESGNNQSSNTEAGLSNLHRSLSDVFGPGNPSQRPRGSTRTRLNTSDSSGTQLGHINAVSFVKNNIVSKVNIMDVLALHLDRSACPGLPGVPVSKRWEHLADVFKVPDEIKRQCDNFTGNQLTPSEAMFEYLRTAYDFLEIETLKSYLRNLGRNDVVDELEKNNNLTDEPTVNDLCENHPKTMSSVCLKLDDKRNIKNWRHLGLEIGINEGTLRRLKDPSGFSPSKAVLKKIQTLKPRLPTTELAAVLDSVKLPGIAKVLREFSVSHRDESTIKTLFDDIDALEKVTALLDLEENSWQRVGRVYGIDKRLLDSLKPDPIQSPTKVVMEYIVQKEPTLTMKTFLRSLKDIERFDVIEDLKEFFYADDIDGILEARDPSPL